MRADRPRRPCCCKSSKCDSRTGSACATEPPPSAVCSVAHGDQALRAFAQHAHHQAGVFERRKTHADGNVEALADHVDPPVGAFQLDPHAWAPGHEARQRAADLVVDQARRAADANGALRLGADPVDHLLRRVRLDQHGQAMPVIVLADLGDDKAPGRALDQPHAEALFEQGDAPAEFGLGQLERAAGGGKAQVLDDLDKIIKIIQILHRAIVP